jgi:hypothetical protein
MRSAAWGLLALAVIGAACRSPEDCGAAPAAVVGRWTYSASQSAPSTATVSGILTLQAGCPSFQGSLDGTERDALGNTAPVHVPVAGQMLNATSVQFDAYLGVATRQHLGALANDTIRGTWVDQTSGSNGSFVAAKELTP